MTSLLVALHALAAAIWVGGMFFAYLALRPAVAGIEPAAERPRLWRRVFARFFPWVSAAAAVLLVTGYALVFGHFGGMRGVGLHVHIMQGLGWVMFLLYGHLYFAAWKRFRTAVDTGDLQAAGPALTGIRRIVATNLLLGLIVIAIGASGRYWP